LKLKKGAEVVAEFKKILDHRGANWGPLYPLSYVGVARRNALAGDTTTARKAYESSSKCGKLPMRICQS
jgi:hypothetical protein